MDNTNIDLIRSHMDTIILRTLQSSDKYGLEILNEIKSLSDDLYTVKQPTLYSSLKRLENQGLILSCPGDDSKGANRTYYRLTDEGRAFLEADQNQWEFARTIIDKLLSDKVFDKNAEKPFEPSDYRPLTKRTKKETEEKIVVKYVEVEKPIYIDRVTGEKLTDYSPENYQTATETPTTNEQNALSVYSSNKLSDVQTQDTQDYVVKDEVLVKATEDEDNSQTSLQTTQNDETEQQNNIVADKTTNNITTDTVEETEETAQTSFNEQVAQQETVQNEKLSTDDVDDGSDDFFEYSDEYNNYHVSGTQFTEDDYYESGYTRPRRTRVVTEPEINESLYINDKIDYVSLIQDVITESDNLNKAAKTQQSEKLLSDYEGEITMADLEQALEKKGITLSRYHKPNAVSYYAGNYFYSNKLLKDWSWITYFAYLVFIAISFAVGRNVGIQWTYSLGFAVLGLILPITCTIIWSGSPLRKRRNNLTLNNALLSAFILMIAFTLVILIVAFFIVQIKIQQPESYVPALVVPCCSLILLPLSVVIYALLFKIKNYHLK